MRHSLTLLAVLVTASSLPAQQRPVLTAADYARAEKFMGYNANPLVSKVARMSTSRRRTPSCLTARQKATAGARTTRARESTTLGSFTSASSETCLIAT